MKHPAKTLFVVASQALLFCAATANAQPAPPPYANIGDDARRGPQRCFDNPASALISWSTLGRRCPTYPSTSLDKVGVEDDGALVAHLASLKFSPKSDAIPRRPEDPSLNKHPDRWPRFVIQAMPNPKDFQFRSIAAKGIIMARIDADPYGPRDKRYGIGGLQGREFDRTFYIAAGGYDAIDTREAYSSRKVSNWYVYGVETVAGVKRLVRVGNTGTIRWCRHGHLEMQKADSATFTTCGKYAALARYFEPANKAIIDTLKSRHPDRRYDIGWLASAIRKELAKETATGAITGFAASVLDEWVEIFSDPQDDPAWMTCGAGCCTADVLM